MNKDELLKIYSAYLQYKLELRYIDFLDGKEQKAYLSGVSNTEIETTYKRKQKGCSGDFISWNGNNNVFDLQVKPVFYDLSYLTKPIEGGIYVINEIADVISKDQSFSIIQSEDAIILDFDEEYVFHIISMKNMMQQPYEIIKILLKYHFNVFNLPESEYINKATLTK